MQSDGAIGGDQFLIERMQGQRAVNISGHRLSQRTEVVGTVTAYAHKTFGASVVRFQGFVADGPFPQFPRQAVAVSLSGRKIVEAGPKQRAAVEGSSTPENSARVEAL